MGKGDSMTTSEKSVNELKDKTSSTMTLGNAGSRVILIQPESNSSLNVDPQQRQGTNHNAQRKDQKQWMRRMLGIVIFLASVSSMILGFIALVAYFNLLPFSGESLVIFQIKYQLCLEIAFQQFNIYTNSDGQVM